MLEMCSNWSYQVVTLERHDVVYHPHYGFLQTGRSRISTTMPMRPRRVIPKIPMFVAPVASVGGTMVLSEVVIKYSTFDQVSCLNIFQLR